MSQYFVAVLEIDAAKPAQIVGYQIHSNWQIQFQNCQAKVNYLNKIRLYKDAKRVIYKL